MANGIHTLNALEVTPDLATWKKLDPNGQWEEIYNRYAFVSVNVVEQESADVFTLVAPDSFTVHVTPEQLRKLGVSNVLSPQKLDAMQSMGIRSSALAKRLMGEPHIGLFNTSNNVLLAVSVCLTICCRLWLKNCLLPITSS